MSTACDYNRIQQWIREDLIDEKNANVGGVRWVTNGHIMFAVVGEAPLFDDGKIRELLATDVVVKPAARVFPVRTRLRVVEDDDDAGGSVRDYKVLFDQGGIELALCYAAVVPHLFGDVEWYGSGSHAPVVAKVDGQIVAVVMPAPWSADQITI